MRDNVHALNAFVQRLQNRCGFWQHAVCQCACFTQVDQALFVDVGNQAARVFSIFQYAGRARAQNKLLSTELCRDGGSNSIGIDVQ